MSSASQIAMVQRLIKAKGTTVTLRHYAKPIPGRTRVPDGISDDGHVDYVIEVVDLPLPVRRSEASTAVGDALVLGAVRQLLISGTSCPVRPEPPDEILSLEGRKWSVKAPAVPLNPDAKGIRLYKALIST